MAKEIETREIRAFLAVPLAQAFQSEIAPLIEQLKRQFPRIRWVKASDIHVTLHFFGNIEIGKVAVISECIKGVTEQTRPFEIFLQGMGAFPSPRRARVIWVGIKGEIESLRNLQDSIEQNLKKKGFPAENRAFEPHLTLGRIREGNQDIALERIESAATASKKISEVILFRSHLTSEGAIHEKVTTFPFSET